MTELLPAAPLLFAFVGASLLLAITPGPGVLYIVARSAAQGRRAGLASVAGVALGNLLSAAGAAYGLAALFAISSTTFLVAKYAGALYLVYLGLRSLRRSRASEAGTVPSHVESRCQVFRDGLIVALFNPKTLIFFAAFLPQFMSPGTDPGLQGLLLGALFVLIAASTDAVYAIAAGSVGSLLRQHTAATHLGRRLSGITYIGLGLFAAFSDTRRSG
ncbi:MAG: LysE family translocator [Gammaproteobacteria bacterium]|nr:LysE family translocator [Gammaproteobacteria bacterium]